MPNGVSNARPPAFTRPPDAVWQTAQSPCRAICRPRSSVAADQVVESGGVTGA